MNVCTCLTIYVHICLLCSSTGTSCTESGITVTATVTTTSPTSSNSPATSPNSPAASSTNCITTSSSVNSTPVGRTEAEPPTKRKKNDAVEEAILANLKSLQDRRQSRVPKDQEALFGEQVAGTLRRLQPRQREMMKIKISSLLFDAEFPDSENTDEP